ncbi:MAG: mandelate racemase/muconate lactonizing enzyme family protein [Victivallaceae bacterium]|nr:mandelate racemase/muconate lactonizing enzyme family protein [Victivallaceae bacterium]
MKIIEIKTYHLRQLLDEPFGFSQWWYDQRNILLVEIVLDSGISGWGEAYGPAEVNQTIIEKFYKPHLMSRNPANTDEIWQFMYNRGIDFGRKGVMVAALSALDIALWDIKGKVAGKPVYQLLNKGRETVKTVTPYATGMYFVKRDNLSQHLAEEAAGYVDAGFSSVKMKVGIGDIAQDVANVKAVRTAIGENIGLMIDANHYFSVDEALELGKQVEQYNIDWFEEPVSPDDYAGYRKVRETLNMPIAGGECEFTSIGFADLLSNGCVDIAQPDPCAAGGISEMIKISQLVDQVPPEGKCRFKLRSYVATEAGKNPKTVTSSFVTNSSVQKMTGLGDSETTTQLVFHTWGSGVALSVSLQLCAGLLNGKKSNGNLPYPIIEYDRTINKFRENIFIENPVIFCNGKLTVPQAPGLGFEINREYLEKYRVDT